MGTAAGIRDTNANMTGINKAFGARMQEAFAMMGLKNEEQLPNDQGHQIEQLESNDGSEANSSPIEPHFLEQHAFRVDASTSIANKKETRRHTLYATDVLEICC